MKLLYFIQILFQTHILSEKNIQLFEYFIYHIINLINIVGSFRFIYTRGGKLPPTSLLQNIKYLYDFKLFIHILIISVLAGNENLSIFVNVEGIDILVKDSHSPNDIYPIDATESGMETVSN